MQKNISFLTQSFRTFLGFSKFLSIMVIGHLSVWVIAILLVKVLSFTFPSVVYETSCAKIDTISEIGGCDSEGLCSYSTSSHHFIGKSEYPIKGDVVCVEAIVSDTPKAYFRKLL